MIVDSHIHILPPRRTRGLVRWIHRAFPGHPSSEDITADEILEDLRACGAEMFFNLVFPLKDEETESLNEFSRDVALSYECITGFGSLHSDTPRKDEVAEKCIVEHGLAGIKLHPYVQGFEAFSPVFEPLFKKLNELGKPFVVHTGFDFFYGQRQDLDYLRSILERYPDMPAVLVHSLFPRFKLARELMSEFPQLYLDMTNAVSALRWYRESPGNWTSVEEGGQIAQNLEYFEPLVEEFSERVMFGTDHPAGMGSPKQIYADLDWFELSEKARADILGSTALRFLEMHCGLAGP